MRSGTVRVRLQPDQTGRWADQDAPAESAARLNYTLYDDLIIDRVHVDESPHRFFIAIRIDECSGRPNLDERSHGRRRSRRVAHDEAPSGWIVVAAILDETVQNGCILLDEPLLDLWELTEGNAGDRIGRDRVVIAAEVQYHQPITLSRVLLQCQVTGFESSSTSPTTFRTATVFRQGAYVSAEAPNPVQYRICQTSPVRQGIIDKSRTEVVIIPPDEDPRNQFDISAPRSVSSQDSSTSSTREQQTYQFDADAFLSSSMDADSSGKVIDDDTYSDEGLEGSEQDTNSSLLSSGQVTPRQSSSPVLNGSEWEEKRSLAGDAVDTRRDERSRQLRFQAFGLTRKPNALQLTASESAQIKKDQDYSQDDESTCWLSLAGLASAGLFSGDWVLLYPEEGTSARMPRLARVGILDEQETNDLYSNDIPGRPMFLPPSLLHNLLGAAYHTPEKVINIYLSPAPAPSRTPALPVAKSMVLSRIASPHSINARYEDRFSSALRQHFTTEGKPRKRIARRGDLIAVPISTTLHEDEENEEGRDVDVEVDSEDDPDALVYFTVSSITPESLPELAEDFESSLSSMCRAGELGCWVDSDRTKIATVGLESGWPIKGSSGWWGVADPVPVVHSAAVAKRLHQVVGLSCRLPTLQSSILIKGARGAGKSSMIRIAARTHGLHNIQVDCLDLVGDSPVKTVAAIQLVVEKAQGSAPSVLFLRHIEALGGKDDAKRIGQDTAAVSGLVTAMQKMSDEGRQWPVIIIGTTSDESALPPAILSLFKVELELKAPSEAERLAIVEQQLEAGESAPDVEGQSLASQSAGMHAQDLIKIVQSSRESAFQAALDSDPIAIAADVAIAGVQITAIDIAKSLDIARASFADSIGAPKIPNVSWDDVGGLADVKQDILDTVQLPLERPELFAAGLKKRSGILLYGPPGTGKTLLAKAVATSCSLNFFSVKGPELLDMYIGQSEANVRRVFQRARDAQPCVIFMDELDSIAPKRGNQGDSGGVMDRIVSQLLAELDGMSEGQEGLGVFVMAATNRPDLLDSSLLRPGRFDRMLYLSVASDHESQYRILEALTRKFKLARDLDLRDIAAECPFNYTGADFYALCSDAMLKAMTRIAGEVDAKIAAINAKPAPHAFPHPLTPQYYLSEMADPEELEVMVGREDFLSALDGMVPSVSAEEMRHYEEVQRQFSKETINAKGANGVNGVNDHGGPGGGQGKGKGKGKQRAGMDDSE